MQVFERSIENNLVDFLANIYLRIHWEKMKTSKNPWDIFNHRVRAAARKRTIGGFASKLCNYFGLQSLPLDAMPYLEALRFDEEKALNLVYQEHIPLCMKAIIKAKEMKQIKKEQGGK